MAAFRVNSDGRRRNLPKGRVISVDLAEMLGIDGVEFLQLDVRSEEALERLRSMTNGHADVVISDMSAPATGHSKTDHLRIMALCEDAAGLSFELLRDGGSFVCKVLSGGTENILLADLKPGSPGSITPNRPPAAQEARKNTSSPWDISVEIEVWCRLPNESGQPVPRQHDHKN